MYIVSEYTLGQEFYHKKAFEIALVLLNAYHLKASQPLALLSAIPKQKFPIYRHHKGPALLFFYLACMLFVICFSV